MFCAHCAASAPARYATGYTIANLLPATEYHFRVRTLGSMGAGNWSKTLAGTTQDSGTCGNTNDVLVYKGTKDTMQADIQHCLVKCATKGQQCVDTCVSEKVCVGAYCLTKKCSDCWFAEGTCTIKHCALKCVVPTSAGCAACSEKNCFPACVTCSGMPTWAFPKSGVPEPPVGAPALGAADTPSWPQ